MSAKTADIASGDDGEVALEYCWMNGGCDYCRRRRFVKKCAFLCDVF